MEHHRINYRVSKLIVDSQIVLMITNIKITAKTILKIYSWEKERRIL